MGPYNERQGGQILRKCYEKLGDGQTTKLRGEAVRLIFQLNSVYSCILWLKSANRPGYFKTMSGEEWLLSRTPVGAQDTRQPALRTNTSLPEIGSQLFTYASNAIKGLYKLSCSSWALDWPWDLSQKAPSGGRNVLRLSGRALAQTAM